MRSDVCVLVDNESRTLLAHVRQGQNGLVSFVEVEEVQTFSLQGSTYTACILIPRLLSNL